MEDLTIDYRPKLVGKTDYGIGIIGFGWVAQNYHLPAYRAGGFNIVAVADLRVEAVETAKSDWDIPYGFTDYRALLELKGVDIVDVLTPRRGRVQIVKDAAAAGKHIVSQKPFADNYAEALAMVEAAESARVLLGIHQHYHWLPGYRGAWQLLQRGIIGEPFFLFHEMHGNQDSAYFQDEQRRWNAELNDFLYVEWGAHQLDFLRWWVGRDALWVFASGTRKPGQNFRSEMAGAVTVGFEGIARGVLVMNQVDVSPDGAFHFRIQGTEGVLRGSFTRLECCGKLTGGKWVNCELVGLGDWQQTVNDSYIGTMSDLMNALNTGQQPPCSGRDNLKSVAMYQAALRSSIEGRVVTLAEVIRTSLFPPVA